MKCLLCGKEVTLTPSATERAAKYGETPEFYTKLFPRHSECELNKRKEDTSDLMRRIQSNNPLGASDADRDHVCNS